MTFASCHPTLKLKAKGLCASCYDKQRSPSAPRATCHPERARASKDGLCQMCRDRRHYVQNTIAHERRRSYRFTYNLNRKYLITPDEYEAILTRQDGGCAICRIGVDRATRKERLSVDHCHATGRVRGLLCDSCNRAIGLLGDDPDRVSAAAAYLQKDFTAFRSTGSSQEIGPGCNGDGA